MNLIQLSSSSAGIAMFLIIGVSMLSGQGFKREVADMFAEASSDEPAIVTEADLAGLPEIVQRYLRYSGVVGQPRIQAVRLKQRGDMRRAADKPWMPMQAVEYYTTNPPAFIWKGDFKAAPLFKITALDRYRYGRGNMHIKLMGLFKVADLRAPELDEATLIRFFSEGIWFPTVFLEDYITWEAVDSLSAKVIMTYKGVTASGLFTFNELGQVVNFETERHMENEGDFELKPWSTPIEGYKEMNGMMIPSSGKAVWHLEDGEFPYWRGEIFDLEFNNPSLY
jgi:hypothetical protein